MFKIIILALIIIVAVVLGVAATRPDSFRVQRSLTIKAPPEKIAPLIANFHEWGNWSPYEKRDPAMQRKFGGADSGTGATYAWDGNSQVGSAEFTLQPQGDGTVVTGAMYGPAPFFHKLMGLFFNMDKMVGTDFETGLASLKALAEK